MLADRKLAAALKTLAKPGAGAAAEQRARDLLEKIKAQIIDTDFKEILEASFHAVMFFHDPAKRVSAAESLSLVKRLTKRGLPAVAEVVFAACFESLKAFDTDLLLSAAPTLRSVETVLKASGMSKHAFENRLLANPIGIYDTAATDWLLKKGDIRKTASVVSLLLTRKERQMHLPAWDEVLRTALKADKHGKLFALALLQYPENPRAIESLVDVGLKNANVLKVFADYLPVFLTEKRFSAQPLAFLRLLIEKAFATHESQRRYVTAAIVRIATGILLIDDRPAGSAGEALGIIQAATRRFRSTTDEVALKDTWILECLAQEEPDGQVHITPKGARHIAIALQKSTQGFCAYDIVTLTARNLGMVPAGKKGDKVAYDPLRHEDIAGGILPGETVEITEPGWFLKDELVIRAKVIRPGAF